MTKGPVLILGGASDIGQAIAHHFAAKGHPIQLAARNPERLEADRSDIHLRHGVEVTLHAFDALAIESHEAFLDNLPALPEVAVCAVGILGQQARAEKEPAHAAEILRANLEGPVSILGALANRFEARGSGTIIGISSVAGDRGRASNYVYGAAKAGFTAFLSGLRNRLAKAGVQVLTVKPGFVATKMIEGMETPGPLTATADEVAARVLAATGRGANVIYVRRIWWPVMRVIGAIPEAIFKKTKI